MQVLLVFNWCLQFVIALKGFSIGFFAGVVLRKFFVIKLWNSNQGGAIMIEIEDLIESMSL
jgi:hypothetical protein